MLIPVICCETWSNVQKICDLTLEVEQETFFDSKRIVLRYSECTEGGEACFSSNSLKQ